MVFLLSDYKILKVCETANQAFYWADLLIPTKGYLVDDVAMASFSNFTDAELCKIHDNHTTSAISLSLRAKWTREVLLGAVLNCIKDLGEDKTSIAELHGKLKRAPEAPEIVPLSDAQREKQMGPVNTSRVAKGSAGASSVQKRPKVGTTTAKVWDIADETHKTYNDIGNKSFRDAVIEQCVSEGINVSTARTQFGHWKRDKVCS